MFCFGSVMVWTGFWGVGVIVVGGIVWEICGVGFWGMVGVASVMMVEVGCILSVWIASIWIVWLFWVYVAIGVISHWISFLSSTMTGGTISCNSLFSSVTV